MTVITIGANVKEEERPDRKPKVQVFCKDCMYRNSSHKVCCLSGYHVARKHSCKKGKKPSWLQ
jgi:hypothetical protein